MIYVVSGFMRTGTSMMMGCLEAGGLEVVYSEQREEYMRERFSESPWLPNEKYYEITTQDMLDEKFVEKYEGKAVKILAPFLHLLPVHEYSIIYMNRKLSEVFKSYATAISTRVLAEDLSKWDREISLIKGAMKDRRSCVSFTEIWYDDVLDNPEKTFISLAEHGWPIDWVASSKVPDKNKRRITS